MKKKKVFFTNIDLRENYYPVLFVSKSELKNRFVPGNKVDNMSDGELCQVADRMAEICLEKIPDLYLRASAKINKKLTND